MTSIGSEVLLVSDLFDKGRFQVPRRQRFYDWNTEHVRELLADIKEAHDQRRPSYFLGSIMLIQRGGHWEINDGQQRLMTLSLIFAAFTRHFDNPKNIDENRKNISLNTLFDVPRRRKIDSENLENETPRLAPPRRNRSQFYKIIQGHDVGSNSKLISAWQEIISFLGNSNANELVEFFDFLAHQVEIAILYIPQTDDANAVFESLNARGKSLEDIDLIRNHIYSYFSRSEDTQQYESIHFKIEEALATLRGVKRSQDYFRCYLQNRYGYLQQTRFYRSARAEITREISVFASEHDTRRCILDLVNDLTVPKNVELYRAIASTASSPEFLLNFKRISRTTNNKRDISVFLEELRPYTVTYPLLFALLRSFTSSAMYGPVQQRVTARAVHRAISNLAAFIVRTTLAEGKFEPSRIESALAGCAQRIAAGIDNVNVADLDILDDLQGCDSSQIMSDANFVERLTNARITDRRSRRAKRLLFGVNSQEQRDATAFTYTGCTVEHVLPQSSQYWPGWQHFAAVGSDLSDWVARLGNLTLLGHNDGYSRGRFNESFERKRLVFEDSPFVITRDLAQHQEWSPAVIDARSRKLAQAAARLWCFTPFSNRG